ncbi:hypothetical protein [Nonlabens marinus]|uniref:Septum formation inhibitor Maf n=1 Tax=Nonlabens marinus S1-08 TaxID=1454201 RepID=W8VXR1_9FLAO|nr:hypothetical protein [Nonlabens marinus]BAO56367.1 hypothetical protein NMS_2358 [Nonlabens marinus S1-08]
MLQRCFISFWIVSLLFSCTEPTAESEGTRDDTKANIENSKPKRQLTQEFKDYWYAGVAEISSYDLQHDRYGEKRQGSAVFIFVTEPFDPIDQIKADQPADSNQSVLKLNATRDFLTGIYPYKIMSSTFLPLETEDNAVKVATSIQEWCGHTYMQFNRNEDQYDVELFSYFQSEGNKKFQISNAILENQIPSQLRLGPEAMPTGEINIIPPTEYLRLTHSETKVLPATAQLTKTDSSYMYVVNYDSGRNIEYVTKSEFPYIIQSWKEEFPSRDGTSMTSATIKKTLRTPYWKQNSTQYEILRDSLHL